MRGRMNRRMSRLARDERTSPPVRLLLIVALVLLVAAVPAFSADQCYPEIYVKCTSAARGNLNAEDLTFANHPNCANTLRQDWGGVLGYREAAQVPMNQDASNPGAREHYGVTVVKVRSKSSPKYMEALVNKIVLQCTIEFDDGDSPPTQYYAVNLANARIQSIELNGVGWDATETVVFRAEQITWTHTPSLETFTDTLSAAP